MTPVADMPGESDGFAELQRELMHAGREAHRLHREVEVLRGRLASERTERVELLAVVAHELRTPITVLGGYLKLLLTGNAGPLVKEQRRYLEEGRRSLDRLDVFVERVVEGSGGGLEGEALEVACGPVAAVIEEVVASFQPVLEARNDTLALALAPGVEARFDRDAVERVLINLIGNAVRHAGEGGRIEIAARLVEAHGRDFVEIAVSDSGPGVPPGDRERIFEPYVQVANAGRRRGLGLGLSICRRIVEAHGGSIYVEDGPAGGSRFVFTLPRADG
jgi:signal transduction histidine kinase